MNKKIVVAIFNFSWDYRESNTGLFGHNEVF